MTTDTRHLDTALAILGAGRKAPRKPRGDVINLYDMGAVGVSVQVNSKEVWLAPDMESARQRANTAADVMRRAGRTVTIQEC